MVWLIGILKFITATIGFFASVLLALNTIQGIVNPQIEVIENKTIERGQNARYILGLIASVAWGITIALP